jgi:folate-binding protein YgfZ
MSTSADVSTGESGGYGAIAFRGPDAAKFLQGQLSADVEKLAVGSRTLAGLHNPQGRVIALLDLARDSAAGFNATQPRALVQTVATRLRKYVLRAKVRVEEAAPSSMPGVSPSFLPGTPLGAVRSGLAEVYVATSEAFVAQMLNLDLLGAIAVDKGCYTGQEVIARAHYRGKVKRRMQRWLNTSGTPLAPGDSARTADGRTLTVVRVAPVEGGQELLAVGNYLAEPASAEAPDAAEPAATGIIQVSGPLPLPYVLPN